VDAKTAAEDVAAGFETASNKVASAFDSAAAELDAVFATAGLNPDDESDGKGALRRALRTP
jgi:hypothetical protein